MGNEWMIRTGKRAGSAAKMRNTYSEHGIQYYLLVEGESDVKFFNNLISESVCKVVDLRGKENVIAFIKKQNQAKQKGYIAIVDADFDNINNGRECIANLYYTDVHDIEMLIISSTNNLRKLYAEHGDMHLIAQAEKRFAKSFINKIIEASYQIGILKYVVQRDKYQSLISMDDLPYEDIVDEEFNVNIDLLISRVKGKFLASTIREDYDKIITQGYDKWQICCGHDVTNLLLIAFMDKGKKGLGYGTNKVLSIKAIESSLRVAYDYTKFMITDIYREIVQWEQENKVITRELMVKAS